MRSFLTLLTLAALLALPFAGCTGGPPPPPAEDEQASEPIENPEPESSNTTAN